MAKILMGAPIRNEEKVLPEYLEAISKLKYPKEDIRIVWILNNCTDKSAMLLYEFQAKYQEAYRYIEIITLNIPELPENTRQAPNRMGFVDEKKGKRLCCCDLMAIAKRILQEFIGDEHYFFYVEADVILKDPETLNKLIAHRKKVVGILSHTSDVDQNRYNILKYNQMNNIFDPAEGIKRQKQLLQVDYVSGDVLFKADLFKNLLFRSGNGGEDGYAMKQLMFDGIAVFVDTTIDNEHRM